MDVKAAIEAGLRQLEKQGADLDAQEQALVEALNNLRANKLEVRGAYKALSHLQAEGLKDGNPEASEGAADDDAQQSQESDKA